MAFFMAMVKILRLGLRCIPVVYLCGEIQFQEKFPVSTGDRDRESQNVSSPYQQIPAKYGTEWSMNGMGIAGTTHQ